MILDRVTISEDLRHRKGVYWDFWNILDVKVHSKLYWMFCCIFSLLSAIGNSVQIAVSKQQ